MPSSSLSDPVIIVGGGTFGTSTAYHLAQRGYTSVTVLDRWAPPSREAAGNDLNKIVRTEYPQPHYAQLAQDAAAMWKDENGVFSGLYHESGWVLASTDGNMEFIESSIQAQRKLGLKEATPITSERVRQNWPQCTGEFAGWKAVYNPTTAWVEAGEAVKRMAHRAIDMGVKYVSGESRNVTQLLFDESSRCIGVKCANNTTYFASQVILAAGAAAAGFVDLKGQIVGKGHTVCHLQLTPEEVKKYADLPIMSHLEGGILFPPQKDGLVKVAANSFVTNFAPSHPNISIPRYSSVNLKDGVPKATVAALREWLKGFIPELAERKFCASMFCWDGDTPDGEFLITPCPGYANLKLAVGGSAHGFKFLPVIGKYIADMMEGTLDPGLTDKWRWRPGAKSSGPDACPLPLKDMNDMPEFQPLAKL